MTMIGVILAGGRSERMGEDKALLPFRGKLLVEPAISVLQSILGRVIISTNYNLAEKLHIAFQNVEICVDETEDLGPLGGIATVLRKYENNLVCLPSDAPFVTEPLVTSMIEQYIPPVSAIKHSKSQQWDGLFSVWNKAVLPELETYLNTGSRSVKGFLDQVHAHPIYWDSLNQLKNVNSPKDLRKLE